MSTVPTTGLADMSSLSQNLPQSSAPPVKPNTPPMSQTQSMTQRPRHGKLDYSGVPILAWCSWMY